MILKEYCVWMVPLFLWRQTQRAKWTWIINKIYPSKHGEDVSAQPEKAWVTTESSREKTREVLIDLRIYTLEAPLLGRFLLSLSHSLPLWPSQHSEAAGGQGPGCSSLWSLKLLPKASSTGMQWLDMWQPEICEDISGNARSFAMGAARINLKRWKRYKKKPARTSCPLCYPLPHRFTPFCRGTGLRSADRSAGPFALLPSLILLKNPKTKQSENACHPGTDEKTMS